MKPLIPLLLILAPGLILSSCSKDSGGGNTTIVHPPYTGPYLYVGGTMNSKGVYWKIGLSDPGTSAGWDTLANSSNITSIVTSGKDVYMAGQAGGYWKNDTFVAIQGANDIQYLTLSGNTVYAAGFNSTQDIAWWGGQAQTDLQNTIGRDRFPDQSFSSYGFTGICVSGSNVYLSGLLSFQNEPGTPDSALSGDFGLLWKNGNLTLLGTGQEVSFDYQSTSGIGLLGNDLYIAGRLTDTSHAGGYWKNGVWNPINNGFFLPSSLTIAGSDVYIPGATYTRAPSYLQQAVYWKNGSLVTLSGVLTSAVVVNGSDLYVLGVNNIGDIMVWKNGALFKTLGSASKMTATCMAIGN
jgi:hypothetical protein